jgi:hypothetical protein
LGIEAKDEAGGTYVTGEPDGVAATTDGGVDGEIAGAEGLGGEGLGEVEQGREQGGRGS